MPLKPIYGIIMFINRPKYQIIIK